MSSDRSWRPRSPERLPDAEWKVIVNRVRGEFHEMPGMRLTPGQGEALLGLRSPIATWVFNKLESEGFLTRTPRGEYTRHGEVP